MDITPIHLIDDDRHVRESLCLSLRAEGFLVLEYSHPSEFIARMDSGTQGCVLTDLMMPDIDGVQLLEQVREDGSEIPFIFMTGHSDHPAISSLIEQGLSVLEKPFRREQLLEAVIRAHSQ
ncbi:MAG: response regulator [Planctomycetota bacterium]